MQYCTSTRLRISCRASFLLFPLRSLSASRFSFPEVFSKMLWSRPGDRQPCFCFCFCIWVVLCVVCCCSSSFCSSVLVVIPRNLLYIWTFGDMYKLSKFVGTQFVPQWLDKLPPHIQYCIAAFIGLHIAGVVFAVIYYFNQNTKAPFKKKMK